MKKPTKAAVRGMVCSLCLGAVLMVGSGCDKEMLGLVDGLLGEIAGAQGAGSASSGGESLQEYSSTGGLVEVKPNRNGLMLIE
ncbi:MAG: hypothetical protein GXP29_09550 [Planctomycetes bacterium]|nr:hypothetical protein [Planctomycetota bacterium]